MSEKLFQLHAIKTLTIRGLKSYFESPAAYVALFVFYLLAGYLFTVPLFVVGQASIKSMLGFVPLLMTFLIPALTMGLLAEEAKTGTFENLATLPLEDWDIVLGKYLGFAGLSLFAVAGLGFFPIVLSFLTRPPIAFDWREATGILLAMGLLGLMFGAIGLWASSLSKSQIIVFLTSFFFCFLLFAAGKLAPFAPGLLGQAIDRLGIDSHIGTLAKGVLDSRDLVYFASMTLGFLYLTVRRLQMRRI